MQTLANFRRYEDEDVRRDPDDGQLHFQPDGGLPIHFEGREPELWDGWRATFSVKSESIYTYCLSTVLSEDLAERFNSRFCVRVSKPLSLISRIRNMVRLRSSMDRAVYFKNVEYRTRLAPPGTIWALPEQVAFVKPLGWSWQNEFRIVAGKKGAFAVHNLDMTLEHGPQPFAPHDDQDPLIIKVGSISQFSQLITF